MSNSNDHTVSRRAVLGGAAGVAGAGLAAPRPAQAGQDDAIDAVASRLDRDLIDLRRDLHQHPEIAGQEERTARVVAERLRAAGLRVTTGIGGHGVLALLTGDRPGRTIAYRADMDAVPPEAQIGGGTEPAHLCGHDLHTTVGVGVAEVLAQLRDRLAGTVAFVFQPAEEALTGAAAMLDAGVFARVRPAEIHALHCGPWPVGQFVVTPGYGLPGLDRGVVTLTGADAVERARQLAADFGALGTVSPPATPQDLEQLVTDLETPDGPLAEFVFMQAYLPAEDRAEIQVFYRCWPEHRYVEVRQDIHRLARAAGGATVSFPDDPFPAMISPEREGQALKRHLLRTIGRDQVGTLHAAVPFNGEDFALFLDRVPGTFTFLGVRAPGSPIEASYPHFAGFTPDEGAIGHGVRAMAGWLSRRTRIRT
jgi:metal-dependent amidase/aminoacylase/carboxypeptidase family protein